MSKLIENIRRSVVGDNLAIDTVFGEKPLVYADYTASGRALSFIEDAIRDQVLPYYANTHTETSFTGAISTRLREEARVQIRSAVNASEDYSVIFCGSGATAANQKLIDVLNLRLPAELNDRYDFMQLIPEAERPVVFIGPYEHHSNEIMWRECLVELVVIPIAEGGGISLSELEQRLNEYSDRPLKIGSFSAASNVTGVKSDVEKISSLLHQHNALAFFDYAAAGPYVGITMLDEDHTPGDTSKDAIFLSPHKFVGGPGTPGILVVHNKLLNNKVPAVPGGGTVMYVTPEDHKYVDNHERREEAGTPAIVESIRAGLVFKLQQQVGTQNIERLETSFIERAIKRLSKSVNIKMLGDLDAPRLSILSFSIQHQHHDLHYGFIVAVLNDLFGIQARGGCSCAGPYAHHLLGLDMAYSKAIEAQLVKGQMILRPGWVRINFNYFLDEETFDYILTALELVAEHAWRLLPYYQFDESRGLWQYQGGYEQALPSFRALDFESTDGSDDRKMSQIESACFGDYLRCATQEMLRDRSSADRFDVTLPPDAETLRWFIRPQDIVTCAS